MTEIQLPCCDSPTLVERLEATIHCDDCGIDLDLAPDEAVIATAVAA